MSCAQAEVVWAHTTWFRLKSSSARFINRQGSRNQGRGNGAPGGKQKVVATAAAAAVAADCMSAAAGAPAGGRGGGVVSGKQHTVGVVGLTEYSSNLAPPLSPNANRPGYPRLGSCPRHHGRRPPQPDRSAAAAAVPGEKKQGRQWQRQGRQQRQQSQGAGGRR